jgi:hypothetical protein
VALGGASACDQEVNRVGTEDQLRAKAAYGRQPTFEPTLDRVGMKANLRGEFGHRVVSMPLEQPGIGVLGAHRQNARLKVVQ